MLLSLWIIMKKIILSREGSMLLLAIGEIGSTFKIETGTFSWQPGHGFVGRYRLVFV